MLGIELSPGVTAPRYNIAPTQEVLVARVCTGGSGELIAMRWGLVPRWSKGPDNRYSMINARAETVHQKPAYRAAFRYRRCLIPSEGFYEWKATGNAKQPYFIGRRDKKPFMFAGLWERWEGDAGESLESFSIIVTAANDLIKPIHERMPVILAPKDYALWLDPQMQQAQTLLALLAPFAYEEMEAYPVSREVNNPRNEGPELAQPYLEKSDR